MALDSTADIIAQGMWPQGDIRDPLGIWGGRELITGDASGGSTRVIFRAPDTIAGAYLYTCYSVNISTLTSTSTAAIRARLLTNWPDVDPGQVGVQGYSSHKTAVMSGSTQFNPPFAGQATPLIQPQDRYVLLFDPRPVSGGFDLVDLEINSNVLAAVIAFECWGYYWDRSVLQAPAGPRHPGSS